MSEAYTPDSILKKLETPEECDQFAINIRDKYPEVAKRAKRRSVELRALQFGAVSPLEREALEVIYAYEAVLAERNKRKTAATRTWQMIERHGIRDAIERAVSRETDPLGFLALREMGMEDLTFEELVLRHPEQFSEAAVHRSKTRLEKYRAQ